MLPSASLDPVRRTPPPRRGGIGVVSSLVQSVPIADMEWHYRDED